MPFPYIFPFFFEDTKPYPVPFLNVEIDGASVLIQKRTMRLHSELGQRVSTAQFTIVGEETWSPPSLACAPVNAIGGFTRPFNLSECIIDRHPVPFIDCAIAPVVAIGGESSYIDHFFGGFLAEVEKDKIGVGDARVLYHCKAQDYNILPVRSPLVTEAYVAQTEQQILDDLFGTYLPEIDTSTYVESSGATYTLDWTRRFLNECVEELAGINEKQWFIDHEKFLHYFTPVTTAAPFILSDEPSLSARVGYKNIRHPENIMGLINRVTVVGDPLGPIVVTRTSAASFALYGRYFDAKYVDENIDTANWANDVGDAILAENEYAKVTGKLFCYQEGLIKGQKVRIINHFRNIDAFYLIQSITMTMISALQEKIDIEYGDYKPRLTDLLLRISKEERKE